MVTFIGQTPYSDTDKDNINWKIVRQQIQYKETVSEIACMGNGP